MKDYEYYSNVPVEFPERDDYTTCYLYSKGKVIYKGNIKEIRKKYKNSSNMVTEKDFDRDAYTAARKKYSDAQNKLVEEFKNDLFEEYGVENNPKREKCYALAWEHGNSSGFSNIDMYFSEFVELIKD